MFTPQQQSAHCRQLADLLDSDQVKGHYNHNIFCNIVDGQVCEDWNWDRLDRAAFEGCGTMACAFGWAAIHGIGGLQLDRFGNPYLPSVPFGRAGGANWVFGPHAYDRIFNAVRDADSADSPALEVEEPTIEEWRAWNDTRRRTSIELLRNQAALLETQPELA